MPGGRLEKSDVDGYIRTSGAQLITFGREGYGLSSPLPGRLPVDSARAVTRLGEYFNLAELGILATSGGCTQALAALRLPAVGRVAIMTPSAPMWALKDAWFDHMDPSNIDVASKTFSWNDMERVAARGKLSGMWKNIRINPVNHFIKELRNAREYSADVRGVSAQERIVRRGNLRAISEGLRYYREGWQSDVEGWGNWGFDPRELDGSKLLIMYGGKDQYMPPQHGAWLAENIPNATSIFFPDATHKEVQRHGMQTAVDWCLGEDISMNSIDANAELAT
jgi:pimeloyl-ACP methyl ester carboxylesterase